MGLFLFQRIEEMCTGRTDAIGNIGQLVLERRTELDQYSTAEIAELTFTSKASTTRFAKALGYSGWKDFIHDYDQELYYEEQFKGKVDFNFPFQEGQENEQIAFNLRDLAVQAIDDTLDQLNFGTVSRIVNLMQRANRIVIFCVSPHTYSAELFQRKMMTIQKPVTVAHIREMGITARSMNRSDLAIIISYSGNNRHVDPMNVVEYLKNKGIPLAVITSAGQNYLHEATDTVLTISSRENLYTKIATFATEESVQYLLNILYSCYFARNYKTNRENKIESGKMLESTRTNSPGLSD